MAREYNKRNIMKRVAHRAVAKALKDGTLVRSHCEFCPSIIVDAHHDDYNKPLNVRWVCKLHHRLIEQN